ncbi:hypothetical protein [Spirosoma arcticum]
MKHYLLYAFFLLPLLATAQEGEYYQKQPAGAVYVIALKDGTKLRGELLRQDSTGVVIKTKKFGEVRLPTDQIARMGPQDVLEPVETFPNLFSQTMRVAPTAFSAEKGRVYFRNYFVYFSQFEYGITDNWSVGTTFFSIAPTALFSVNTKVSFPVTNRVRLGLNAQYATLRINNFIFNAVRADIGYLQGIVTTGDRQNNTTYGLGWSLSNGEVSRNFIGTFGLVRKVSPKLTFITENFVLFGSGRVDFAGLVSAGIRFDRRRHAFDLAVYAPLVFEQNSRPTFTLAPFGIYHLRIGK